MRLKNVEYQSMEQDIHISYREKSGHYTMAVNHFHDMYEIYYLLSGERYYFVKNRTYRITKGDLVFINIQDLHKTIDAGVPDHQRILINFKEIFVATPNSSIRALLELLFTRNSPVIRLGLHEQSQAEGLLLKMVQEAQQKGTSFEVSLQALLMQFLVYIGRHAESSTEDTFEHPSPMHKKVSEIVQYINNYYMEPITLSLVSERFYVSQFHLSRIFKEATGFTFIEYLNSTRVKEAQKLLRESQWKVIQIAEKVGFGSISQFGRVFKEVTGLSPLDYRKSSRV